MRKRKDVDKDHADQESSDGGSAKKARVVWSIDVHQKFVNAVNQIGFDSKSSMKLDYFTKCCRLYECTVLLFHQPDGPQVH